MDSTINNKRGVQTEPVQFMGSAPDVLAKFSPARLQIAEGKSGGSPSLVLKI